MNKQIKDLIIKNEMKAKAMLPELDLSISKFVNYINKASKDYILYEFLIRSVSSVQQKEKKKKMNNVGLTHASDLIKEYKDNLDLEVIPMEKFFFIGKDYSIIDISFYSNSFHFEKGMYIVDEDTIILKAGLNDKVSNTSKYPNKWIERYELLEYSFMEEKDILDFQNKDYKHNENKMIYNSILGSKTIKIHLFVRYEKKAPYEYMGIYKPIKLSNENKSFILHKNSQEVINNASRQTVENNYIPLYDGIFQRGTSPEVKRALVNRFSRSSAVKQNTLNRAIGICELCNCEAPFKTKDGSPFLEVHHIKSLSENGVDDTTNTVALCPNCHRKMHYAELTKEEQDVIFRKLIIATMKKEE